MVVGDEERQTRRKGRWRRSMAAEEQGAKGRRRCEGSERRRGDARNMDRGSEDETAGKGGVSWGQMEGW